MKTNVISKIENVISKIELECACGCKQRFGIDFGVE